MRIRQRAGALAVLCLVSGAAAFGEHLVVRLEPGAAEGALERLKSRGARILAAVPAHGFVVSMPEGVDWPADVPARAPIEPASKWSPLAKDEDTAFLAVFHEDVDPGETRRLALAVPLAVQENPYLAAHHLLVLGTAAQARALTELDQTAYILPASADLVRGVPVAYCAGVLEHGYPRSLLADNLTGPLPDGWTREGSPGVVLGKSFGPLSVHLDPGATRAAIDQALTEWSKSAWIDFEPRPDGASGAQAPRTLHFLFATGDHGDPFPFRAGVLAHAFAPSPRAAEPLAGDVHFNDEMPFQIGADLDVFSVALHEIGHALGLGHLDAPGAVMYPYYRKVDGLSDADREAIRRLYAERPVVSPDRTPPTLVIRSPATGSTTQASVTLTGTAADASGIAEVRWENAAAGGAGVAEGTANWSARIGLVPGFNTVIVRARDGAGNESWRSVVITRR